jgi:hypothetical protein
MQVWGLAEPEQKRERRRNNNVLFNKKQEKSQRYFELMCNVAIEKLVMLMYPLHNLRNWRVEKVSADSLPRPVRSVSSQYDPSIPRIRSSRMQTSTDLPPLGHFQGSSLVL